ncbi:MAG: DUF3488 and transglutaminase-like domain-containing protein [Bifidobacteriaceae bacterium]|jgi:hypothetical protein|nr:DUF3488 and transglutaminase-like domain-containing protein [Bifidobacteriaceae bacterium]
MTSAGRLTHAAAIAALVAVALAPLAPVFTWPGLIRAVLGGLCLGGAVAVLAARRGLAPLPTLAVAVCAYLVVGPALAVPELAAWRLLPTLASEQWLASGLITVWRRLLTVPVPVLPGGGFGLAPFVLAYTGTGVGASLAIRLPHRRAAWAALVPLAVSVVAIILGTRQVVLAVPAGVAMGLGLLAWVSVRSRAFQPRRLVALAVIVAVGAGAGIVVAGTGPARERLVVRDRLTPPFDPRDYPSPLSGYRRYLKASLKSKTLLRVRGLPAGGVVKLAVMDRFDGVLWNVAGGDEDQGSGNFGRMVAGPAQGKTATVHLQDHDSQTVWLYSVGSPRAIEFAAAGAQAGSLRESVRTNSLTGTMALPPSPPDGIEYSLDTVWSAYRPGESAIAAAGAGPAVSPSSANVQAAAMTAASVTARAPTAGAKALALERFLQDGYYSDGQTGPGQGSGRYGALAGHGAERLSTLLTGGLMVGDAEQYASAMAVMARSLDLPARVVMGFAPGYGERADPADGGEYTFKGADMTAWTEVNLDGLGWVGFFPTPNRQDSPERADQRPDPKPNPEWAQPPPPEPRASLPPEEDLAPVPVGAGEPLTPGVRPVWGLASVVAATVSALVTALMIAAAGVAAAKGGRRRRRFSRGTPALKIMAGWEEVVDQLRDLGLVRLPAASVTRLELARAGPARAQASLVRLAGLTDAAAFGGVAASGTDAARCWEEVKGVGEILKTGLSWWRRLWAALTPRSLWPVTKTGGGPSGRSGRRNPCG